MKGFKSVTKTKETDLMEFIEMNSFFSFDCEQIASLYNAIKDPDKYE